LRIGSTSRDDKDGSAVTFISEKEIGKFKKIEKFLGKELTKSAIPPEIGEGPSYVSTKRSNSKWQKNKTKGRFKTKPAQTKKEESADIEAIAKNQDTKKKRNPRKRPNKQKMQAASKSGTTNNTTEG
ncbi:MAG: hypothetical protein K2K32_03375, partial [Muribaculaceae bacterium]|nr:hypothetical protein [Muribaculaceae bacterium]